MWTFDVTYVCAIGLKGLIPWGNHKWISIRDPGFLEMSVNTNLESLSPAYSRLVCGKYRSRTVMCLPFLQRFIIFKNEWISSLVDEI